MRIADRLACLPSGRDLAEASGMGLEQADQIKGNSVAAVASWGGGTLASLSKLAGQQVQVRVAMMDAKLFSVRLVCAKTESPPAVVEKVQPRERQMARLRQEEQGLLRELARVRAEQLAL